VRASGIESSRMNEQNWQIVEKIVQIAERLSTTPTRVTLAWHLSRPFMTAPIVGANNVKQLEDSMGAVNIKLSGEDVQAIDEVSGWQRARTENEN
jgi:aryl-alcohol dehydrogenase-like predicted oxidoreductase